MFRFAHSIGLIVSLLIPIFIVPVASAQQECPNTPVSIMSIGIRGRVTFTDGSTTSLREQPTTSSSRLMRMPEGFEFDVIDGPVCADGYNFWQLQTDDGLVGWAAEGNLSSYWIEPLPQFVITDSPVTVQSPSLRDYDVLFMQDDILMRFDFNQSEVEEFFSLEGYYESNLQCPQLSDDGQYIAFTHTSRDADFAIQLVIVDVINNEVVTRINDVSWWFDWAPNSLEVAYTTDVGLMGHNASTQEGRVLIPREVAPPNLVPGNVESRLVLPEWSPNGSRIFIADSAYEGFHSFGVYDLAIQRYFDWGDLGEADWSQNSEQLVFSDNARIFMANYDGSERQWVIGDSQFPVTHPLWSPNLNFIVFNEAGINPYQGALDLPEELWILDTIENTIYQLTDTSANTISWSPNGSHILATTGQGIVAIPIDGSEPFVIGEGRCAEWLDNSNYEVIQEQCEITSVSIDDDNANGVVSGQVIGSGCSVILEVRNRRSYWVNLSITPVGNNVILTPDGDQNTSLAGYQLVPPDGSIQYRVDFNTVGQSVTAFLDVTTVTGDGAREMNLITAVIDLLSLVEIIDADVQFGINFLMDYYPSLRNTISLSPNLQDASIAMMTGNYLGFIRALRAAKNEGELTAFANTLQQIGISVARDQLTQIVDDAIGIPFFNAGRIIWRNYRNAFRLWTSQPAGFVIFTAEGD